MVGGHFGTTAERIPIREMLRSYRTELDKLTDAAGHKFALRSGVGALLCPNRNGTRLQADAQRLDIGRLAVIEFSLMTSSLFAE